jgi:hypothetical protein
MESKDGALLPRSSRFPPSAPHTGQVAFTTSGAPTPAAIHFRIVFLSYVNDSILLSVGTFGCPEFLNPFALYPAFPDSLGGRDSTDSYGFAAPTKALATSPPILDVGSFV